MNQNKITKLVLPVTCILFLTLKSSIFHKIMPPLVKSPPYCQIFTALYTFCHKSSENTFHTTLMSIDVHINVVHYYRC